MFKLLGAAVAAVVLACAAEAQAAIIEEGPLPEPGQDGPIAPTLYFTPGAQYASTPLVFSALGNAGIRQVFFGVELYYRHWTYDPGNPGSPPDWLVNETLTSLSCGLFAPGECQDSVPMGGPGSTSFDFSLKWDGNQVTAYWKPFDNYDTCAPIYTGRVCRIELLLTTASLEVAPLVYNGPKGYRLETASPAPEPATWAMMIAGFGLAGGALRLQRAVGANRARGDASGRRQHV